MDVCQVFRERTIIAGLSIRHLRPRAREVLAAFSDRLGAPDPGRRSKLGNMEVPSILKGSMMDESGTEDYIYVGIVLMID